MKDAKDFFTKDEMAQLEKRYIRFRQIQKEDLEIEKLELEVNKLKKEGIKDFIKLSLAALAFAISAPIWYNNKLFAIIFPLIFLLITLMAFYFMDNMRKSFQNTNLRQKVATSLIIIWFIFSIFLFAYFLQNAIFPILTIPTI